MHFYEASLNGEGYDMGAIFNDTLTKEDSWHSVTFVDNHDTQKGSSLPSFVEYWFKPIAYGIILLQEKGVPCVFYGDYVGTVPCEKMPQGQPPVYELPELMKLRQSHAYGYEHDYYDHKHIVGFTREGDKADNGLALICSAGPGGEKAMFVGKQHAHQLWKDALGKNHKDVYIDENGYGVFACNGGSISVYVPMQEEIQQDDVNHDSIDYTTQALKELGTVIGKKLLKKIFEKN